MKNNHCNITLIGMMPALASALLAGGCGEGARINKAGEVDEIPLLVRFNASHCPEEVIQSVESCDSLPPGIEPGKDLACRGKDKSLVWLAVMGDSVPYLLDKREPEFTIEGELPAKKANGGACTAASGGVLVCKIDRDARSGVYKYSVIAGNCKLDPRVYVY